MCASLYSIEFPTIGGLHPEDATDPTLLTTQHVNWLMPWEHSGEANNCRGMAHRKKIGFSAGDSG